MSYDEDEMMDGKPEIPRKKNKRVKKADLPALPCKSCYIGIDLSLQSPGVAVLETNSNKWHLFGFHQHIRKFHDVHHDLITLFPQIPDATVSNNNERYKFVTDHILEIVQKFQTLYPNPNDLQVSIEGYAFKKNSAHASKLKELCGLLKYRLYFEYGVKCQILPPTKWKKYGTGKGIRSKLETGQIIRAKTGIDLFTIFGIEEKEDVENPVEDIYDSMGIVFASKFMHEYPHLIKDTRTKKQKAKDEAKKIKLEEKQIRAQKRIEKSLNNNKEKKDKTKISTIDKKPRKPREKKRPEQQKEEQEKLICETTNDKSKKRMRPVASLLERKLKLESLLKQKEKSKRKKLTKMEDEFEI